MLFPHSDAQASCHFALAVDSGTALCPGNLGCGSGPCARLLPSWRRPSLFGDGGRAGIRRKCLSRGQSVSYAARSAACNADPCIAHFLVSPNWRCPSAEDRQLGFAAALYSCLLDSSTRPSGAPL